jgi:zinc-ribbon domain
MDIGSLFLILGLLVLVILFISRPLLEKRSVAISQEEHQQSALMAERDRVITALQELDFDYALGKIPEADYPSQRAVLIQRGVEILRNLDTLQAEASSGDAEGRIEAAIAARRADAARVPVGAGGNGSAARLRSATMNGEQDDDLEALIANRRRQRNEKAAGFCPQCGGPVQKSDAFCPKCGTRLA